MNTLAQTEETLKQAIMDAILQANLVQEDELPAIQLEKPKEKAHGDFATNIAMQLARFAKKAPRLIAEDIVATLDHEEASIETVEIAGPGFINFFMKDNFLGDVVQVILDAGSSYGQVDIGSGQKAQVEFVSVNPTGDLHLGHARGAAFGDVLCNLLEKAGYQVDREYYINDAGNQMDNLALSVEARYLQELGENADMPEDGYYGDDIVEVGKTLAKEYGDKWLTSERDERLSFFREYGLSFELGQIKADLQDFRVEFDTWFSEASLYENNKVVEAVEKLKIAGVVYESDGATWLRSTDFGDDKDRVLIKQNGDYTYLTPDIAYHKNKFDRGYDQIINVWGADHHGYIPRMRAAMEALGYPVEAFDVSVIQMVSLLEEGETVRMSKRAGTSVSLRELVNEVGVDAVRYYFVMRSNESQLDFDLDLAKSESNDNPVYYVQYAHARICTMLTLAETRGYALDQSFDPGRLTSEKETDLLKKIAEFPQVVADAAHKHAPHKMTQYVFDVASVLHSFYNAEKVLNDDDLELTKARIALMQAVRVTIANGLNLLGVHAPVKM